MNLYVGRKTLVVGLDYIVLSITDKQVNSNKFAILKLIFHMKNELT